MRSTNSMTARTLTVAGVTAALSTSTDQMIDFRTFDLGVKTDRGTIRVCPLCGERGAAMRPKFLRRSGAALVTHSLAISNGRSEMTPAHANPKQNGFCLVSKSDTMPRAKVSKKVEDEETTVSVIFPINSRRVTFFGPMDSLNLLPRVIVEAKRAIFQKRAAAKAAAAKASKVLASRSAGAQKAWVTMRANAAAKAAAAGLSEYLTQVDAG